MVNNSEPWIEGIRAFEAGKPRAANPYSSSETAIAQAIDWFGGWDMSNIILDGKPLKEVADVSAT